MKNSFPKLDLKTKQVLTDGAEAVSALVNAWESGDLAATVRALDLWALQARALLAGSPGRYESKTEPGLFFWAELNHAPHGATVESFVVVSQMKGFPATDAHYDYFANFADADQIASRLALDRFFP